MKIEDCKSYSEMAKFLGYEYYNGRVKKSIVKYCKLNNLDPDEIIAKNGKMPNKCLYCGKELEGAGKYTRKFCNTSCAASFNNKGRSHSNETKNKIKYSLKRKYKDGSLKPHNLGQSKDNTFVNITNERVEKRDDNPCVKYRKCIVCGNEFEVPRRVSGKYSKTTTCSNNCRSKLKSIKSKEVAERLISEGRHVGWKSRNIVSYPEQFWIKVLENNNIEFKHNFPFGKYFLDFYIEISDRKIDLEIDGKQHKYADRHESDIVRDEFVKSRGVEVFRIDWNSINTEDGKKLMKEKIEEFLNFIGKIIK